MWSSRGFGREIMQHRMCKFNDQLYFAQSSEMPNESADVACDPRLEREMWVGRRVNGPSRCRVR